MIKILIFTDSRGEHNASFQDQLIFTEKITLFLQNNGVNVDKMCCPFSWTSTLDFIEIIEKKIIDIDSYDKIILFTGVVEFSPRPLSNFEKCYQPEKFTEITFDRLVKVNRQKEKIINNKREFMSQFIPSNLLRQHLESSYEVYYDNQDTRSLISFDINEHVIIPYLKKLDSKLIYINTNSIVPEWEGNYILKNKLGRPKNIHIISEYAKQMQNQFTHMIDLMEWTDEEIKKYTVDNMHLSYEGSEWIFNKLVTILK